MKEFLLLYDVSSAQLEHSKVFQCDLYMLRSWCFFVLFSLKTDNLMLYTLQLTIVAKSYYFFVSENNNK